MNTVLQDLRFAVRQLSKSPGFTLAAILTLTIGIGANAALFSSMDAVVMHPLVVPQLDRVMSVSEEQDGGYHWVTLGNFEDWSRQSRSFQEMALFGQGDMSLTGAGDAAHVDAAVAAETNYSLWEQTLNAAVYLDDAQLAPKNATYAVITEGNPLAVANAARKALSALDPGLPLDNLESWQQMLHEQLTGLMYTSALLGVDALIALLLAAIGIFGVMANQVGERTREIGVRLAMGARREDVLRMILRRASWLTGAGVCIGLLMAFALAHAAANLLRGVSPNDPVVFGVITTTIVGIALLSSWIPARRASRIEPMVALRDE